MSEIQWYIQVEVGKKAGPIPFERLQQIARQGKIFPKTNVRSTEDGAVWTPAEDVPGLYEEDKEETSEEEESVESGASERESTEEKAEQADAGIQDSAPTKSPAIRINVGPPKDKTKTGKKAAFTINPGKSSKEKATSQTEFVVQTSGKPDSKKIELDDDIGIEDASSIAGQAVLEPENVEKISPEPSTTAKIDLSGLGKKKKPESSPVGIKIELDGSGKKKAANEKSSVMVDVAVDGEKTPTDEIKPSTSSPVSVSLAPMGSGKKKSSEGSSIAVNIGAGGNSAKTVDKPVAKMVDKGRSQKKADEEKPAKTIREKDAKKSDGTFVPKILSMFGILLGLGGGGAVIGLGWENLGGPLAGILGGTLILLGVLQGATSWMLSVQTATKSEEYSCPSERDA